MSLVSEALRNAKSQMMLGALNRGQQEVEQPQNSSSNSSQSIGLQNLFNMQQALDKRDSDAEQAQLDAALTQMKMQKLQAEMDNIPMVNKLKLLEFEEKARERLEKKKDTQIKESKGFREKVLGQTEFYKDLEELKKLATRYREKHGFISSVPWADQFYTPQAKKEYDDMVTQITEGLLANAKFPRVESAVRDLKRLVSLGNRQGIDSYINGLTRLQDKYSIRPQTDLKKKLREDYPLVNSDSWEWVNIGEKQDDDDNFQLGLQQLKKGSQGFIPSPEMQNTQPPQQKSQIPLSHQVSQYAADMLKGGVNSLAETGQGLYNMIPGLEKKSPYRINTSGNNPSAEAIGGVGADVASMFMPGGAVGKAIGLSSRAQKALKMYKNLPNILKGMAGGAAGSAALTGVKANADPKLSGAQIADRSLMSGAAGGAIGGVLGALPFGEIIARAKKIVPKLNTTRASKIKSEFGNLDSATFTKDPQLLNLQDEILKKGQSARLRKMAEDVGNKENIFKKEARNKLIGDIDDTVSVNERIGDIYKRDYNKKREAFNPIYNKILDNGKTDTSKAMFSDNILDALRARNIVKNTPNNARAGHDAISLLKGDKRAAIKRLDNKEERAISNLIDEAQGEFENYLGSDLAKKYKATNKQYKDVVAPYKADRQINALVKDNHPIDQINLAGKLTGNNQKKEFKKLLEVLTPEERAHLIFKDKNFTPANIIKTFENNKSFVKKWLTSEQYKMLDRARTIKEVVNIYDNAIVTTKTGEKLLRHVSQGVKNPINYASLLLGFHDPFSGISLAAGGHLTNAAKIALMKKIIENPNWLKTISKFPEGVAVKTAIGAIAEINR